MLTVSSPYRSWFISWVKASRVFPGILSYWLSQDCWNAFARAHRYFFRIAERGDGAYLARTLVDLIPSDDTEINRDLGRVDAIRERRAVAAEQYFQRIAEQWDDIRSLHVSQQELEAGLLELVGRSQVNDYLDIGTGTGQVLSLLADRVDRGVGVDLSREMLNLARSNLESKALRNVHVRHGDMYNLPLGDESFDLITLHLVLHYAHNPENVISEASRVLKPGGRLFIIDFSKHQELGVCEQHQHVHPGFTDKVIAQICRDQKLTCKVEKKIRGQSPYYSYLARQQTRAGCITLSRPGVNNVYSIQSL